MNRCVFTSIFFGGNMNKLKIGKIIGTHALKGELKIRSNSDFNDQRFVVGRQLLIGDFQNAFIIKTVRFHKGNFLVRVCRILILLKNMLV